MSKKMNVVLALLLIALAVVVAVFSRSENPSSLPNQKEGNSQVKASAPGLQGTSEDSARARLRERPPMKKTQYDSQGRRMVTLEEIAKELDYKPEYPRESQEISRERLQEMKSKLELLLSFQWSSLAKETPKIENGHDAYKALSNMINVEHQLRNPHSFKDDGEVIFVWYGHSDEPGKGYAVRKKDAKLFKWSLQKPPALQPDSDFRYFSE